MLTLISPKHLDILVGLSGQAIREFLSGANAAKFKGEAHAAINGFQAHPDDFTDQKLIDYGADIVAAIDYPVRIELRGKTTEGVAQMVAKGIWGPRRAKAAAEIAEKCRELNINVHLKLAGTSSIEFNVQGVDKSVPIRFLQGAFEEVLREMNYQPGPKINSAVTKTVIAADGDGTIYDGPRMGSLPTLAESPVKEPLIAFLRAGGIFMLISGNDINRTFKRIADVLPKEVHCRVLIAANGGAELIYVDAEGHASPILGYKVHALSVAQDKSLHHKLDIFYVGDDGAREGNDYPAFKTVGFDHSILVAKEFLADYDPALKSSYVGGLLQGTRQFLEDFLSRRT
jgi:hypothetical protein